MTPKNYILGAQVATEIMNGYREGNINLGIEQLEKKSLIELSSADRVNWDSVLIVNPCPDENSADFIAIWHVDLWYSIDKGAAVLKKDGNREAVKDWKKLIKGEKDLIYYKIILEESFSDVF